MSMSTHVKGFRPPDAKWKAMKQVYDACDIAGVPIPEEVDRFFNYEPPDKNGVEVEIKSIHYSVDATDIYEVYLKDIPIDITVIRFSNSW